MANNQARILRDVKDEESTGSPTVVTSGNRSETFLASGIPKLNLNGIKSGSIKDM